MPDKHAVKADVYVEDSPSNIRALQAAGCDVIIFENSTNIDEVNGPRARDWEEAEVMIRERMGPPAEPEVPTREELLDAPPET